MKHLISLIVLFASSYTIAFSQTYCIGYSIVSSGATLVVDVSLQGSSAFALGTSTLVFTYNGSSLTNPTLVTDHLAASTKYNPTTVVKTTPGVEGRASINVFLKTVNDGSSIAASPASTPICRLSFDNSGVGTSLLNFDNLSEVFLANNATLLTQGMGCPSLNVVLPVEMLSFRATKVDKTAQLHWDAIMTTQVGQFVVERSTDGAHFQPVGEVKAGMPNQKEAYNWIDNAPFSGINYYRLSWVEFGKKSYSNIVSVIFDKIFDVKVSPNPAFEVVRVDIASSKDNGEATLEIIDLAGRSLMTRKISTNNGITQTSFDLTNFVSGAYIIRVQQDSQTIHHKLIKN